MSKRFFKGGRIYIKEIPSKIDFLSRRRRNRAGGSEVSPKTCKISIGIPKMKVGFSSSAWKNRYNISLGREANFLLTPANIKKAIDYWRNHPSSIMSSFCEDRNLLKMIVKEKIENFLFMKIREMVTEIVIRVEKTQIFKKNGNVIFLQPGLVMISGVEVVGVNYQNVKIRIYFGEIKKIRCFEPYYIN